MTIAVKKELSTEEQQAVWQFLSGFDYIPYQQFPEYSLIEGLKITHFIGTEGNKVTGWAQVVEKKNILAVIEFGPLGQTVVAVQDMALFIAHYYKKHFFLMLRWMPYCYQQNTYEHLVAALSGDFIVSDAGSFTQWSSKRIALHNEPDVILKTFSENHRRSIKKASAQNLVCRVVQQAEIEDFSHGFIEMYQHRKLHVNAVHVEQSFRRLYRYLQQSGRGFFMGAFQESRLLGGVVIIYQGNTAFYYKGFMNHEIRQLPINHSVFYNAILKTKADGMLWFDFGGYAVSASDEQLININKFKDGFRGELIHFPPIKTIQLRRVASIIHKLLLRRNKKQGRTE